jgi:uncharacterized repeat protein (TIGR01451 family)
VTTNTNNLVTYGTGGGSPLVHLGINDGDTVLQTNVNNGFQTFAYTGQLQNVAPGDTITYLIHYKNISTATLSNVVLNVILPSDVTFTQSTQGVLTTNNTVAVALGTLSREEEGTITIQGVVSPTANPGSSLIATATLAFTTPSNGQDSAIAYALNTVSVRQSSLAGLALFGYGFFPSTLLGWILLLGILILIILIARHYYYRGRPVYINNNVQTGSHPDNLPH